MSKVESSVTASVLRGPRSKGVSSDSFVLILCGLTVAYTVYSLLQYENLSLALTDMLNNPLLGGPKPLKPLPLWTYVAGHVLPAVALQLFFAGLFYVATREWERAPRHDGRAVLVTVVALIGSAPIMCPVHKALAEGQIGRVYHDWSDYPLWWSVLSGFVSFSMAETWFYWTHRAMHASPFLYKHIHSVHHSFNPSTAMCASAFHPFDIASLTIMSMSVPVFIPIHQKVHSGVLIINAISSIWEHTNFRVLVPGPLKYVFSSPHTHNIHHDYGMVPRNCGSMTVVWDRLCGTYAEEVPRWVDLKWKPGTDIKESADVAEMEKEKVNGKEGKNGHSNGKSNGKHD